MPGFPIVIAAWLPKILGSCYSLERLLTMTIAVTGSEGLKGPDEIMADCASQLTQSRFHDQLDLVLYHGLLRRDP